MFVKPKALLFDFDGVVVDSKSVHYNAWKSAYHSLFNKSIGDFPEFLTGKSPMQIAEHFATEAGQTESAEALYDLKDEHIVTNKELPDLLPGVVALQKWATSQNIPYGIASNATRQFLKKSVVGLSLDFPVYFGFEDYKKPKPDPEAYKTLANALKMKSEDFAACWIFEDSLVGLKAAKSAGMYPIGILTQYNQEQLKEAGAQLVFPTCKEAFLYVKEKSAL
ncbi:HAD family phosphatase [Aquimarina sp. ERC-38]|uniref:HAD family hydrolase n=1 Tax=Aquimarina sp. ERC-38 TaxID=2949996 RepID=UPI002245DEBA|nr:HAD family phosphatase [Aquimarina sp. ERC-38]UZO81134.1 HAD family phosphatase [Aquimarina sp. ERC-38]